MFKTSVFWILNYFRFLAFFYFLIVISISFITIFNLYFLNIVIENIQYGKSYLWQLIIFISSDVLNIFFFFLKYKFKDYFSFKIKFFLRNIKTKKVLREAYDSKYANNIFKSELVVNVDAITSKVVLGIFDLVDSFFILSIATSLLFYYHWILGVIAISLGLLTIIITYIFSNLSTKYNVNANKLTNHYNGQINHMSKIRNAMYIAHKLLFFNSLILRITLSKNSAIYKNYMKSVFYFIPIFLLTFIAQFVSPIITAILAKNNMVPISLIMISTFVFSIVFSGIMGLPTQFKNFIINKRILSLFLGGKQHQSYSLNTKVSSINLQNINIKRSSKKLFSSSLNLKLPLNSKIHLAGKNGIGKTSLLQSLKTGQNYSGSLLINNKHRCDSIIQFEDVIFLSEYPHIFNATLRENITFFNNKYSESQILDAASKALLSLDLDQKIDSSSVSDGQRQKISLARMFLISANFIFIDEGLNNISVKDRRIIEQHLINMKASVILISHKEVNHQFQDVKII